MAKESKRVKGTHLLDGAEGEQVMALEERKRDASEGYSPTMEFRGKDKSGQPKKAFK
jgi:hypothetical protein